MACGLPILRFEQHCNTEATFGCVATFAQFFSSSILTSSSRTVLASRKSRVSLIPFAVLLPIDPSQNFQCLLHSMLSCSELTLQISKYASRVTESRTVSFVGTNTNSQGLLIG